MNNNNNNNNNVWFVEWVISIDISDMFVKLAIVDWLTNNNLTTLENCLQFDIHHVPYLFPHPSSAALDATIQIHPEYRNTLILAFLQLHTNIA